MSFMAKYVTLDRKPDVGRGPENFPGLVDFGSGWGFSGVDASLKK